MRRFRRIFLGGAFECPIDKQGRILMPHYLQNYADIKIQVFVVGVSNRIEIWARESWKSFFSASLENFEKIAEKFIE